MCVHKIHIIQNIYPSECFIFFIIEHTSMNFCLVKFERRVAEKCSFRCLWIKYNPCLYDNQLDGALCIFSLTAHG
jgi:hypothetical protein